MTSIPSITRLELDLPPSCIAFCPTQPSLFVVGTYHLHREQDTKKGATQGDEDAKGSSPVAGGQQRRSGTLDLFQLDGDNVYELP